MPTQRKKKKAAVRHWDLLSASEGTNIPMELGKQDSIHHLEKVIPSFYFLLSGMESGQSHIGSGMEQFTSYTQFPYIMTHAEDLQERLRLGSGITHAIA